ncbi:hypothetical protein KI387_009407, partial [Taxus chinensis]
MKRILERYRSACGGHDWNNEHEQMLCQFRNLRKENEDLHREIRYVMGEDADSLSPKQLDYLEGNLEIAAKKVRERKTEVLKYERRKTESKVNGLEQKCILLKQWLATAENLEEYDQTPPPTF